MIAVTRGVPTTIEHGQITFVEWSRVDYVMAAVQHRQYCRLLAALGCEVVEIRADDRYPDCVFVEDTAVVLDDIAVITRPGAESRRGETRAVADVLESYRPLVHIEAPATLDGGDVLVLGEKIYVGISQRTNLAAVGQLRYHTRREVVPVEVRGALHLKTAVTRVSRDMLLINRDWVDPIEGFQHIDADPSEPFGANALLVGEVVVYPSEFPRTRARLEAHGIEVRTVDHSELAKVEGGVTCGSLLFEAP